MLPLLNETKYQSHVRVRVRFRSGVCRVHGSCPVRVRFVSGFVSGLSSGFASGSRRGLCPGSCPVRVWLVFGAVSYPGS